MSKLDVGLGQARIFELESGKGDCVSGKGCGVE